MLKSFGQVQRRMPRPTANRLPAASRLIDAGLPWSIPCLTNNILRKPWTRSSGQVSLASEATGALSHLLTTDLNAVAAAWANLPVERRLEILAQLARSERQNHRLDFNAIYGMALDDTEPRVRRLAIDSMVTENGPVHLERLTDLAVTILTLCPRGGRRAPWPVRTDGRARRSPGALAGPPPDVAARHLTTTTCPATAPGAKHWPRWATWTAWRSSAPLRRL